MARSAWLFSVVFYCNIATRIGHFLAYQRPTKKFRLLVFTSGASELSLRFLQACWAHGSPRWSFSFLSATPFLLRCSILLGTPSTSLQQHVPQEHSHRQAMFLFLSANSILNQSHILLSNSNCILLLNTYYSWISLISLTRYKHTWLIYIVLINRFWTKNFSNYLLNECNRVIFQNQATYITIT